MNLILFEPHERTNECVKFARDDRRYQHIRQILRAKVKDSVRIGQIEGQMGVGQITALDDDQIHIEFELNEDPPPSLPVTLYLALPRPKFLAKVLQTATSLGVKQIYLLNAYRVEKVYWSCAQIQPDAIRVACQLGLEQARDTVFPTVMQKPLFKPFVEDELPTLIRDTKALVAHPPSKGPCPRDQTEHVSLAIGPEGGFIDYEIEKLEEAGFKSVSLSARILKVETAVANLLGRLF